MDGNKAAYWIAVAALAFGLNAQYRDGGFASLHRAAEVTSARAESMFQRLTLGAEQTVAEVRAMAIASELGVRSRVRSRSGFHGSSDIQVMVASSDSAEMAREKREMIREQVLAKAEALRAQFLEQREIQRAQAVAQAEMRRARMETMRVQLVAQRAASERRIRVLCPKLSEKHSSGRISVLDRPSSIEISSGEGETF